MNEDEALYVAAVIAIACSRVSPIIETETEEPRGLTEEYLYRAYTRALRTLHEHRTDTEALTSNANDLLREFADAAHIEAVMQSCFHDDLSAVISVMSLALSDGEEELF